MSIELTEFTENSFSKGVINPQLVLEIDGIDTLFGALSIKRVVQYGDAGLTFGSGPVYGGKTVIEDQQSLITLSSGTSTKIKQTLNSDKGQGSSVSSMAIQLVDRNGEATALITPGNVVEDLLGRKAKLWYGPADGIFKQDFFLIFRGVIDDIQAGSGWVQLVLSHPDQKKRGEIFPKATSELFGAIDASTTTIVLDNATGFFEPITAPGGGTDASITHYVRIDDELISYTGISGNTLTGVTRGALGTTASSHSDQSATEGVVRIEEDVMDLALKLMLSGWGGPYKEDIAITNFVRTYDTQTVANAIYFDGIDIEVEYGIVEGDYITTTGATNGANNVSEFVVDEVFNLFDDSNLFLGSYIVVSGASFVEELDTSAVMAIRSQFDTLSDGLKMSGDETDVAAHLRIKDLFLASHDVDLRLTDSVQGKEVIEKELYLTAGAFSIPRKTRASVGIHSAPLPTEPIKSLTDADVKSASKIKIRRTTSKNFYNTIIYKFDQDIISDRFLSGAVYLNATSLNRIPVGRKPLKVESTAMRTELGAEIQANIASARLFKKFKFGAEFIEGIELNFEAGVNMEIGDIVDLDLSSLKIADIQSGTRTGDSRLFLVDNWSFDFRRGAVTVNLVDTNFDKDQRRALIGPASPIKAGISSTQFVIEANISDKRFGQNEFKKWELYPDAAVRIRSKDFTDNFTTTIGVINGNTITVEDDLGFTPGAGYIMELAKYNNQPSVITNIYGFISDGAAFDDGKVQYTLF